MKLIYLKETLYFWLVKDDVVLVEGGHIQIAEFIKKYDIMCIKDFTYAIKIMDFEGHGVAHFGILGGFLYTDVA